MLFKLVCALPFLLHEKEGRLTIATILKYMNLINLRPFRVPVIFQLHPFRSRHIKPLGGQLHMFVILDITDGLQRV